MWSSVFLAHFPQTIKPQITSLSSQNITMIAYNKYNSIVAVLLRSTQLLFSILAFALAAAGIAKLGTGEDALNLSIATGVISVVYLAVIMIPNVIGYIPGIAVLVGEFVLFVLWLSSMAVVANYWGNADCSYDDDYYSGYSYYGLSDALKSFSNACKLSKAVLAFDVLNFVLFGISLVLHIMFVTVPNTKTNGFNRYATTGGLFSPGALFSSTRTLDNEKAVGVEGPVVSDGETQGAKVTDSDLDYNTVTPAAVGSGEHNVNELEPPTIGDSPNVEETANRD